MPGNGLAVLLTGAFVLLRCLEESVGFHMIVILTPPFSFPDCEQLVRKMLVLDPTRRYTIEQIKRHRWMQAEELPSVALDPPTVRAERTTDPNEQVLRVMQELGIDVVRTREVRIVVVEERVREVRTIRYWAWWRASETYGKCGDDQRSGDNAQILVVIVERSEIWK